MTRMNEWMNEYIVVFNDWKYKIKGALLGYWWLYLFQRWLGLNPVIFKLLSTLLTYDFSQGFGYYFLNKLCASSSLSFPSETPTINIGPIYGFYLFILILWFNISNTPSPNLLILSSTWSILLLNSWNFQFSSCIFHIQKFHLVFLYTVSISLFMFAFFSSFPDFV